MRDESTRSGYDGFEVLKMSLRRREEFLFVFD